MIISFHSLIFICAIYSHFTGGPPLLSFLYLQIHNYFFPLWKYLSCAIFSFFKSTVSSCYLLFLAFSLGEISPNKTMFLVYSRGEISPYLCSLYLQMYDYFFPFSDIHICYLYPFHWRGRGKVRFLPLLSFLYMPIYNHFFPFSQYLSCVVFSLVFSLFIGEDFPLTKRCF